MKYTRNLGSHYSPLYFLPALTAGALALCFFMLLTILTPHRGMAIPSFMSVYGILGELHPLQHILLAVGLVGFLFFTYDHARLMQWNIRHYKSWKGSEAYTAFMASGGRPLVMALPLALGLSLILGLLLSVIAVPYLWTIREFLLPLAMAAFAFIGVHTGKAYLSSASRLFAQPRLDTTQENILCAPMTVASFAVVALGFAMIAQASDIKIMMLAGFLFALFFLLTAFFVGFGAIFTDLRALVSTKTPAECVPLFLAIAPTLAILGVTLHHMASVLEIGFGAPPSDGSLFLLYATMFVVALYFTLLGGYAIKTSGWFEHVITGTAFSIASYLLVLTGLSLCVLGHFLINGGLVSTDTETGFSIAYGLAYAPVIALHIAMIRLYFKLNRKLFVPVVKKQGPTPSSAH